MARIAPCATLLALLSVPVVAQTGAPFGPTVMGRIVWPGQDVSRAQVLIFSDQALTKLVDRFAAGGEKGAFVLILDPGEYYLMGVVDVNANGKLDTGDGVGFYGVPGPGKPEQERKPVKVAADSIIHDVVIAITARRSEDGKWVPIEGSTLVELPKPEGIPAVVAGAVTGADAVKAPLFVLILAAAERRPAGLVAIPAGERTFDFTVPPGDYEVLVIADVSGDEKLGPGDAVGAYGVADWAKPPAELPKLTLASDARVGGLEIALNGRLAAEGLVNPPEGAGALRLDLATLPAIIAGAVPYAAAGLKPVQVRLAADPGMSQPLAATDCKPGSGAFAIAVAPRTYYLTAMVDENGDGKLGPGDAIGFYGVSDLASGKAPPPVAVSPGSIVTGLTIPITIRISDDGKAVPIQPPRPG
jgi:uncharacterized protein (DUF2141 family)